MSYIMCQYRYFVCPIEYSETLGSMTMDCEPSSLFRPQEYTLPESLSGILQLVCIFALYIYSCPGMEDDKPTKMRHEKGKIQFSTLFLTYIIMNGIFVCVSAQKASSEWVIGRLCIVTAHIQRYVLMFQVSLFFVCIFMCKPNWTVFVKHY
jgi:hypothetical protein